MTPTDSIIDAMRLLQFGDSMLPVGAFSFSNGIEAAIAQHVVHDVESLKSFVKTALKQSATSDGIALIDAHRAAIASDIERVVRADRALLERKWNEETRTMTLRMGRKLAELAVRVAHSPVLDEWLARIRADATPGTFPVSLALVFASNGLAEQHAFAAQQYGIATMMISAALRLMKISYVDGQAILYEVSALASKAYAGAATATIDDMAAFAPVADILAAMHVRSHVRIFMS